MASQTLELSTYLESKIGALAGGTGNNAAVAKYAETGLARNGLCTSWAGEMVILSPAGLHGMALNLEVYVWCGDFC
jgi:hypothetical protein